MKTNTIIFAWLFIILLAAFGIKSYEQKSGKQETQETTEKVQCDNEYFFIFQLPENCDLNTVKSKLIVKDKQEYHFNTFVQIKEATSDKNDFKNLLHSKSFAIVKTPMYKKIVKCQIEYTIY